MNIECFSQDARCFNGWLPGSSLNVPIFAGRTIVSSSGAEVSSTKPPIGNSSIWVHFLAGRLASRPVSPAIVPTPAPLPPLPPTPAPVPEYPIVSISEPPLSGGNVVGDGFDIDKFIATANFKPGLSAAANARGAAAFRADAKRAAKQAKLTPAQTKKLMDAVNKAIQDGLAKLKNKPLPKPKPPRRQR